MDFYHELLSHDPSAAFPRLLLRRGICGDSGPDTIHGEAPIEPPEDERGAKPCRGGRCGADALVCAGPPGPAAVLFRGLSSGFVSWQPFPLLPAPQRTRTKPNRHARA